MLHHEQKIFGEEKHTLITFSMVSVMASNYSGMYASAQFYCIVRLPVYVQWNGILWHASQIYMYVYVTEFAKTVPIGTTI